MENQEGIVFVMFHHDDRVGWTAHQERIDGDAVAIVDESEAPDAASIIRWARARARRVIVTIVTKSGEERLWAGIDPIPPDEVSQGTRSFSLDEFRYLKI